MPLDFKHRYVYRHEFTEKGIYFTSVKISYRDKHIFGKFVFCKKNIDYFEGKIKEHLKPLGIKQNLKDVVVIEISVLSHHGNTTVT